MSSYIEINIGDDVHCTVKVSTPTNYGSLEGVLEDLVKPALLASGFMPENVNQIVIEE